MFRHLRLLFLSNRTKSSPKVSKKFDSRIIYFHHLFLKVLLWTREMHFWQPCFEFFAKSWIFPLKHPTLSNNYTNLQKKIHQTFSWTRRLQIWQNWQNFTPKVRFILLKNQKVWANVLPSTNCPIIVPLETYNVVLATPPIFFCENKDTFAQRPKSSCKMQNSFFFSKNDLKLFLWTRKKSLKTLPFFC